MITLSKLKNYYLWHFFNLIYRRKTPQVVFNFYNTFITFSHTSTQNKDNFDLPGKDTYIEKQKFIVTIPDVKIIENSIFMKTQIKPTQVRLCENGTVGHVVRLGQVSLAQLSLAQLSLAQLSLAQLSLAQQARLGYIRLGNKLTQVRLCENGTVGHVSMSQSQVRLGQVRLGQVRLGQVRLGQVRLGQVRLYQIRYLPRSGCVRMVLLGM